MPTVKHTREASLDFLKIVSTLLILLHHYQNAFGVRFGLVAFGGGSGKFYFGYVVELFFLISGYLAAKSVEKIEAGQSFRDFFLPRVIRIVPLAAISTLFYTLCWLICWRGQGIEVWKVLVTCLCVQSGGLFSVMYINSHLWYLSVLLLCTFLLYLLTALAKKLGIKSRYLFLGMVLIGLTTAISKLSVPFLNEQAARGYMSFFLGILLYQLLRAHQPSVKLKLLCGVLIITVTLAIVFCYNEIAGWIQYLMTFLFYPALLIVCRSEKVNRCFEGKFFSVAAAISFDVYVWHFEFNTFSSVANTVLNLGIDFGTLPTEILMIAAEVCVGVLSYYILDKPISSWLKTKLLKAS